MKEFRKIRIQREVAEILASIDQARGPTPRITPAIRRRFSLPPRQIGLAALSCLLGVLMGQSIAMKALETGFQDDYQFTTVGYTEPLPMAGFSDAAFPELPEIEVIYVPNLVQAGKLAEVQI